MNCARLSLKYSIDFFLNLYNIIVVEVSLLFPHIERDVKMNSDESRIVHSENPRVVVGSLGFEPSPQWRYLPQNPFFCIALQKHVSKNMRYFLGTSSLRS